MTDSVAADIGRAARRGVLAALALATLLGAGGCSSVPDAVNPVEWYRGTRDWIAGDDRVQPARQAEATPVPGADKPFPSLNSVPERPAATPQEDRRQMARSLEADREAARYTDEQIRRQTADVTASPSAAPQSAAEAPPSPSPPADPPAAEARSAPPSPERAEPAPPPRRAARPHQPVPVEVQNVEPSAGGQTAAVSPDPPPPMPAEPPPPPAIPPVVAAGQPIPVDPAPAQPSYSVPAMPPAGVEVGPGGERTAFVRPDPFSTRFPSAAGTIRGPRTLNPPPPAAAPDFGQGRSPGFATAPVERFAPDGPPVATVYFNVGSAKIGARGRRAIRDAFRAWQSRGGSIRVVGHASSRTRNMDRVSHELANFRVSDERARAVARELVRLGVAPTAIVVEAVSDHEPAFQEVMPAGEAGNRRAEILLEN